MLPLDQADDLITKIVGDQRVAGQRDAVEEIARLCGYLPLAVRIAASRLRDRPAWSAAYLAERLRDESGPGSTNCPSATGVWRRLSRSRTNNCRWISDDFSGCWVCFPGSK
ncbi:hypothetical protein [Fodinicola feengrottensis]|uniref:hypothetical protein n=1 Tax=Fodinicola feengrottensis TaxID=435914 RepID=UPI0013D392A3|nr:hypothetical protein [Fodinicola feengrottensis]